jgi:hypothetical protein
VSAKRRAVRRRMRALVRQRIRVRKATRGYRGIRRVLSEVYPDEALRAYFHGPVAPIMSSLGFQRDPCREVWHA